MDWKIIRQTTDHWSHSLPLLLLHFTCSEKITCNVPAEERNRRHQSTKSKGKECFPHWSKKLPKKLIKKHPSPHSSTTWIFAGYSKVVRWSFEGRSMVIRMATNNLPTRLLWQTYKLLITSEYSIKCQRNC